MFFQLATDTHSLRGDSKKLFVPCTMFYNSSEVILQHESDQLLECIATTCIVDAPSTNAFKNRLDKHWTDMGA